jgi:hypothetical protein
MHPGFFRLRHIVNLITIGSGAASFDGAIAEPADRLIPEDALDARMRAG